MTSTRRIHLPALAFALATVALAPRAQASGFQLREQGASAQGVACAGVSAGGADISSMFFNPATLTRFEGGQFQLGFSNILPSAEFSNGAASRSGIPSASPFSAVSGSSSHGNAAQSAVTPTLYAMWSLSKDLKVGLSVNVPYGLTTEYDPSWIGRYHAIRSHLETVDIAPTVAYRFNDQVSGGVSFVARKAKAELSQAVDLGYSAFALISQIQNNPAFPVYDPTFSNLYNGAPVVTPGAADGSVFVSGDAWGYGWKAGLTYEPTKALHIGLGFQSAIKEKVKGDATFTIPGSVQTANALLAQINGASHAAALTYLGGALAAKTANGPVTAEVNLPSCASLGISYDVNPTFTLSAEVQRTQWSTFDELRIKFADPATQPDAYTTENWKDTTFIALGAVCHPAGAWTYRAGIAFDKAPVDDAYRTPRIPDADRTWLSAGVAYQFAKNFGIDVAYTHIFAKDAGIDLKGGADPTKPAYFQGNLSGTYKNAIDIWALQARWSF